MVLKPHSLTVETITENLNCNLDVGLIDYEANIRLQHYGENKIQRQKHKSKYSIFTSQFLDPIIYILIAAALLAFLFQDWLEGIAVLIVIIITIGIGFFMELQALRSLESLRKISQIIVVVIRNGKINHLEATLLVPGDLIFLEKGDVVPADARLFFLENFSVKEAALTGESSSIEKQINTLPVDTPIYHQNNMIFKGTIVVEGNGKAIVVATGTETQIGRIQQLALNARKEQTPLEKKLKQLSKRFIWITLLFMVITVAVGYINGEEIMFMIQTGIALAVATIPEGLPVVATIALAHGMLRLSKKKVIIKELEAVETLGATNIICTDKTGTLTEDNMKVDVVVVENQGINSSNFNNTNVLSSLENKENFKKIVSTSVLCNNVKLTNHNNGDTIDLALVEFFEQLGYDIESIRRSNPEIQKIPFNTQQKMMATVHANENIYYVYAKGAFENIVARCDKILKNDKSVAFKTKKEWFKKVDDLASRGLRTLAFAYKETQTKPIDEDILEHLTFIGVIGFIDPARKDVKAIIKSYKNAGIKVVMMTGDHPGTAKKIAEEIGLLAPEASNDEVIHAKNLDITKEWSDNEKLKFSKASVFARMAPEQKIAIIDFFQRQNNIVGMIGDGINDIPALRKADIGIAMGIRGTDAARESADIILLDDKFKATEFAIKQGRIIFQNIRQFVVYLLSSNFAEIVSVGVAATLSLPAPLLPLQILFLNFITDIFPALALGLGKGEKGIMNLPPKDTNEPIMTGMLWRATIIYGLVISFAVLGITVYSYNVLKLSPLQINNMAFYTLILAQLLNVFNMPARRVSFFKNEVTTNTWVWGAIVLSLLLVFLAYIVPPIREVLSLVNLSTFQLFLIIIFSFGSLVLAQLIKRLGGTV